MYENIFLIATVLGGMLALTLLTQVFTTDRSGFFLGLVVLILDIELLLSWVSISGKQEAFKDFPFSLLLNYLVIPPSLWIFGKFKTDPEFRWRKAHLALFIPAFIELLLQLLSRFGIISLKASFLWFVYSEYLPLIALTLVIILFWKDYTTAITKGNPAPIATIRANLPLTGLMLSITLLTALWIIFSFKGWRYYSIIEYLIISLFFGLAFWNFMRGRKFPDLLKKKNEFTQFNDLENLARLKTAMHNEQWYLDPELSLTELAQKIALPQRYVSYLINNHYQKNFKEYLNEFRVETFIRKARSDEKRTKTLLALALESGFNSKSSFNQVFKNHTGKTPSEFLKNSA